MILICSRLSYHHQRLQSSPILTFIDCLCSDVSGLILCFNESGNDFRVSEHLVEEVQVDTMRACNMSEFGTSAFSEYFDDGLIILGYDKFRGFVELISAVEERLDSIEGAGSNLQGCNVASGSFQGGVNISISGGDTRLLK